ncbi:MULTISPECIES: acyl-CoA dehydrogenase family protein [Bradyrhizobium]|uniref:acyl-CoA dehydrogenase family protein n=1 Tax=Bradyrhizobium TaxID=374 RepID=UPI000AA780FC
MKRRFASAAVNFGLASLTGPGGSFCFARAYSHDAKGRLVGVLVDRQAPGLKVTHEHRTRGIIQNTLEFQDVEVPRAYVLFRDQDGWGAAASSMNRGRIGVAAMGLGALERAIQVAASYANHRRLGKLRMIENSHIEQLFGQMVLRREVVKAMLTASCRRLWAGLSQCPPCVGNEGTVVRMVRPCRRSMRPTVGWPRVRRGDALS